MSRLPTSILIHQFQPAQNVVRDDEGDIMEGFYYQFADAADVPLGKLIGPFKYGSEAEQAAYRALDGKDY